MAHSTHGDTPGGPAGAYRQNFFQTQNVPDIILMVLKEKYNKIRPKKHKGNTFCPWVTLKDSPWVNADKKFSNSKSARYHSYDPKREI